MTDEKMAQKIFDGILGATDKGLAKAHVIVKTGDLELVSGDYEDRNEFDFDTAVVEMINFGDHILVDLTFPVVNDLNMTQLHSELQEYGRRMSSMKTALDKLPTVEIFLLSADTHEQDPVVQNSYMLLSNPVFWAMQPVDDVEDVRNVRILYREDDFGVFTFEEE